MLLIADVHAQLKNKKTKGGKKMKNLTKGEMVYRVMMGILIIVAIYVPSISIYLLWALAAGMIISGIIKYCPVCQIINKH